MQLRLSDPSYTDRLATLPAVPWPDGVRRRADTARTGCPGWDSARGELAIYLRVWSVLYPDTEVQLGDDGDDEAPAA